MAATDADEEEALAAEQWRELQAAKLLESDLDAAFRLQMEEAIAASRALKPLPTSSSSSNATSPPFHTDAAVHADEGGGGGGGFLDFLTLQAEEIARFEQERRDRECVEAAMGRSMDDLNRCVHDRKLAEDILRVPEEEWKVTGDHFERPFKCRSASSSGGAAMATSEDIFRLYSKGVVSEETMGESRVKVAGIGFAICDPSDNPICEMGKALVEEDLWQEAAELQALMECLNTALMLDLKRVIFQCDDHLTFLYATGRWQPGEGKMVELVHQVDLLQKKFISCQPYLVERSHIKFAYGLARSAIQLKSTGYASSSSRKSMVETCAICMEDVDFNQMLSINRCLHRYCISCMRQHVVVKLHQARAPSCPYAGCQSMLSIDTCRKFLTPELVELMSLRIKEASIPATEKVYCPYPRCSALMSGMEVLQHSNKHFVVNGSGARRCIMCQGLFCVNCKVPWHANMTCNTYKMTNPYPCPEDAKLKSLATNRQWRQCVKCNHMVELATGCYHIYCRCGYEFCYICGAEWKNKKATCSCPIWDERNIIYADNRHHRGQ